MVEQLIERIQAEAQRRGIAPSTLCREAVNDGKLFKRLQDGGTVTLPTFQRLNAWMNTPPEQAKATAE